MRVCHGLRVRVCADDKLCDCSCLQSFDELDQDAEGEAEPDLLNFSIGESEGGSDGYSTPASGRAYPLSQTSASWVDEMNAELAEFDAMTGGLGGDAPGRASSGSRGSIDAELNARLSSPGGTPGTRR